MPKSKLTAAMHADICGRLIKGGSRTAIVREYGIAHSTLGSMIEALNRQGIAVPKIDAIKIDMNLEKEMHRIFSSTSSSNRQIATMLGIRLQRVNKSRHRFIKSQVDAGEDLPSCGCGQYLHHPRMCWARHQANLRAAGILSVAMLDERAQQSVRLRLLRGETQRAIGASVGLEKRHIAAFLRTFSREDREQRASAFATKAAQRRAASYAAKIERPATTDPRNDPLYDRLSKLVSRSLDPALRDDMISDAYLAVLEGHLSEDDLAGGMRKICSRAFRSWANRWGERRLDSAAGEDGYSLIHRMAANPHGSSLVPA